MPRYFYAIMGPDLTAAQYANASTYEEAARRFAPYVGTSVPEGRDAVTAPGGGLRDLRRAVAALVVHDPRRRDVRADAVGHHPIARDPRPLGARVARGRVARLLGRPLPADQDVAGLPRLDGRERVAAQQRPRVLLPPRHGDRARQVRRRATATSWPRARSSTPSCTRTRRSRVATPRCSRARASTPTASTTTSTRCGSPRTSPTRSSGAPARATRGRASPTRSTRPRAPSRASTRGRRHRGTTSPAWATCRSRSGPLARQIMANRPMRRRTRTTTRSWPT